MAVQKPRRAASPRRLIEEILARAMIAPDPVDVLGRAARDDTLPASVRKALAAVDADGLRLSALLVVRLRFERLMQGSVEASAWFERDPEGFSAAFRRYHHSVPPTASFPPQEAQLFDRFCLDARASKAPERR